MKQLIFYITILLISFSFLISCGSIPNQKSEKIENAIENSNISYDDDEVIDISEEVTSVSILAQEDEEEYIRSTNNLSSDQVVTIEEFNDDKAEILRIIEELKDVMKKEDIDEWLNYISPDSIRYYSNPVNIRKAQKKLPDKTIVLKGIGDYFKYVFIPSRKRAEVKEIRYISKTNIKAVDVKADGTLVVYYQFVKVDNKWLVHIPSL